MLGLYITKKLGVLNVLERVEFFTKNESIFHHNSIISYYCNAHSVCNHYLTGYYYCNVECQIILQNLPIANWVY